MHTNEKIWHNNYDPFVPAAINIPKLTIVDYLHMAATLTPDKSFIDFYGTGFSFHRVRRQAFQMANILITLGVHKGDRVAFHLPNSPQYVIAYYGALMAGAIVVNLNPMYTSRELGHAIEMTGVKVLFTADILLSIVREVTQNVAIDAVIVTRLTDFVDGFPVSTSKELDLEEGWLHYSELLETHTQATRPRVDLHPNDPAVIVFTGGTTGIPKGAVLTHANYAASNTANDAWLEALYRKLDFTQPWRILTILPLFHIFAQIACINSATRSSATMVILPRFEIEEVMGMFEKYEHFTSFPAVPSMLTAIFNHPKAASIGLDKKIKFITSGGAPAPTQLIEQIKDMGVVFTEGWSMTETCSIGACNPLLGVKKVGSIGMPMTNIDIRLVDVDDGKEDVPRGTPGELIIKGPNVFSGYYNNPEETAAAMQDGWLHSGDIATMDDDGYLYIVDRKKDMIIAGGYNIYPTEIDEVLHQHPKILEAASVGVPHEYRGETVKAFVVLRQNESATEEEILAFCKERLAPYKAPKMVEFRDELPKTAIGKTLRRQLREEEIRRVQEKKNIK